MKTMKKISDTLLSVFVLVVFMTATSCDTDELSCETSIWYQDADEDGLGNANNTLEACEMPTGYVANSSDTDDSGSTSGGETVDGYTGTGSVSQGLGTAIAENIFPQGGRVSPTGTITSMDDLTWTVPADVNFEDDAFAFAPDLNNAYGQTYSTFSEAFDEYSSIDIVEVDADGALVTVAIFADNYFEMYVNGTFIGKDAVPFTQFNSHLVKIRVNKPFTVAMLLVDWEENLGLGSEDNQGATYHPGDGGMVAVFMDTENEIIAVTDNSWKAQTYYTAPIKDLTCLSEDGTTRLSSSCDDDGTNDGTSFYGIHWARPDNWTSADFDDSAWPDATTYTNDAIGVDNKSSYTNYTDVFDNSANDAVFIWSTNVVLDNEVLVRKTID